MTDQLPTLQSLFDRCTPISLRLGSGIRRNEEFVLDSSGTGGYHSHTGTLPGLRDILTNDTSMSPQTSPKTFTHGSTPLHGRPGADATFRRSTELLPPLTSYDRQSSSPGGAHTGQSGPTSDFSSLGTKQFINRVPPAPLTPSNFQCGIRSHDERSVQYAQPKVASASSDIAAVATRRYDHPAGSIHADGSPDIFHNDTAGHPLIASKSSSASRYLGVKEYPAEGVFHVYQDGHRIPVQVEGEVVNPRWGLTKANMPRRRLAVACLDCRRKKTKCDSSASCCLQCEKAKRLSRQYMYTTPSYGAAADDLQDFQGTSSKRNVQQTALQRLQVRHSSSD